MNERVREMVERLFLNTAENEESSALREEIENNCQERFRDLREAGYSEHAALSAVADSLVGMEDVIAQLPKKEEEEEIVLRVPERSEYFPPEEPAEEPAHDAAEEPAFAPVGTDGVETLEAELRAFDLRVELGDTPGVRLPEGAEELVEVRREGSRLILRRTGERTVRSVFFLRSLFHNEDGEIRVTLRDPLREAKVHSISGDIFWSRVPCERLSMESMSGDVEAELPGTRAGEIRVSSGSGDLRVEADAESASLRTMSGDIEWRGEAAQMNASSISGDITLSGRLGEVKANSTSGDVDLEDPAHILRLATVSGDVRCGVDGAGAEAAVSSTSGSVTVRVPHGCRVNSSVKTVSGSYDLQDVDTREPADVRLRVSTVSGSIRIRG